MRTEDLPLKAFNHAVWHTNSALSELMHHSDRGSQYLSLTYTDRLTELGIAPSVGSRGDSYDNALAEAVNAAYKTELINRGKPWRCIDDIELATAQCVAWYNQERLHEALGYVPPAEYDATLPGTSHPASQPTPALATQVGTKPGYFRPRRVASPCPVTLNDSRQTIRHGCPKKKVL
jgi:putative transposase